jgi:hypothetical protein
LRRKIFRTLIALLTALILLSSEAMPVYAAAIDVGSAAIDRDSYWEEMRTLVSQTNPANDTGVLNVGEVWANENLTGFEVATFYVVSGNNLSTRDNDLIGNIAAGSKQTFTVSLNVNSGDYLGAYAALGHIDRASTGGTGTWYINDSDKIPCTNQAFSTIANYILSLYATGTTSGGAAYIPKITWH